MDCDSRAKCNDGKCICQGNTTGNGKFCRGNSPWKDWVLAFCGTYCNKLSSCTRRSPALLSYDWSLVLPSDSHQSGMRMLAQHCYLNFFRNLNSKTLSALIAFSKVCDFVVIRNVWIDSRPHYRLMRFQQSRKNRSKMRKLQAVTYVELYAHATNTRACDVCSHSFHFILLRFRPSRPIRFVRFHFDPLPRAFSNRCIFDKNALRISVNERLKRIEMY